MRIILFIYAMLICHSQLPAQIRSQRLPSRETSTTSQTEYHKTFNESAVGSRPIFSFGPDSAKRYYFNHFTGFDSVLTKAIENGDTAKYIRVYFKFTVDKRGTAYDGKFDRIGSTRYQKSAGSKTIKYFADMKEYLDEAIKKMISGMGFWRPALFNMVPVDCYMEDYLEFWVGIDPPAY